MPMRAIRTLVHVVVFSALLFALPAAASARPRVYVRVGPPAPIVDVRRVAPGPRYVWVGGYHRWTGRAYVWSPGRWVTPPRHRTAWIPARWVHDRRGWYLVPGRWR